MFNPLGVKNIQPFNKSNPTACQRMIFKNYKVIFSKQKLGISIVCFRAISNIRSKGNVVGKNQKVKFMGTEDYFLQN